MFFFIWEKFRYFDEIIYSELSNLKIEGVKESYVIVIKVVKVNLI